MRRNQSSITSHECMHDAFHISGLSLSGASQSPEVLHGKLREAEQVWRRSSYFISFADISGVTAKVERGGECALPHFQGRLRGASPENNWAAMCTLIFGSVRIAEALAASWRTYKINEMEDKVDCYNFCPPPSFQHVLQLSLAWKTASYHLTTQDHKKFIHFAFNYRMWENQEVFGSFVLTGNFANLTQPSTNFLD